MIQITNKFNDRSYTSIIIKSIKERVSIDDNAVLFGIDFNIEYELELQKKINIAFDYLKDEKINKIAFDLSNLDSYSISFMNDLVDLIDCYSTDYDIVIVISQISSKSVFYDKFVGEYPDYDKEDIDQSIESDFKNYDINLDKEPLFRVHLKKIMYDRGLTSNISYIFSFIQNLKSLSKKLFLVIEYPAR